MQTWISSLFICPLAGEKKKACDEIFLRLSGSAVYYLIAHRNSLMPPVEIGFPDAVHMEREREEEESAAINITSLHQAT